MYQSTFRRDDFIIHPPPKNLKWSEIWSYLASQAIYMGIWPENDYQHGLNFFSKKSIFRVDNANMINRNAGKYIKALSDARVSSYPPPEKIRNETTFGHILLVKQFIWGFSFKMTISMG